MMTDQDIIEPFGVSDTPLIMVITDSPVYQNTFKDYLLDLNYRIAGPFKSVDSAHAFLRRQSPDLIIFDAITSQSELLHYATLLREDASDLPTLVLNHEEAFSINHTHIKFIYPPIDPTEFEHKLQELLFPDENQEQHPSKEFVKFINHTIQTLILLSPEYSKTDLGDIIQAALTDLTVRNSELTSKSEETLAIHLTNLEEANIEALSTSFKLMLEDIIESIDRTMEASWGRSLIQDTLETVTIDLQPLPEMAIPIVKEYGKGYESIIKKFKEAVPDLESLDRNIIVSKLLLTDWGPELQQMVTTDPSLEKEFDDKIASQLITLVGQGANYHEGIFGPVPIPRSEDVIAIMWSKLIKSDIKDERMGGNTLVIITIGFRNSILNLIPPRDMLKQIFVPLDKLEHEGEITPRVLKKVLKAFNNTIQGVSS